MASQKTIKIFAYKQQISSENKRSRNYENIPDEANCETCKHCPYPNCKTGSCDLIKTKKMRK